MKLVEKRFGSFLSFGEDKKHSFYFSKVAITNGTPKTKRFHRRESGVEQFGVAIYYYKQLPDQALTIVDLILLNFNPFELK